MQPVASYVLYYGMHAIAYLASTRILIVARHFYFFGLRWCGECRTSIYLGGETALSCRTAPVVHGKTQTCMDTQDSTVDRALRGMHRTVRRLVRYAICY